MEFGIDKKPHILLISSVNPYIRSGKLGLDYYNAFKSYGYAIDFLTKEQVPSNKEMLYIFRKKKFSELIPSLKKKMELLVKKILPEKITSLIKNKRRLYKEKNLEYDTKYIFFYKEEQHPPVDSNLVVGAIKKHYDLVIILFWQGLLSTETIHKAYDKLQVPFFFIAIDYSPVTGGCHYFWNCERFKSGCGCCPAWNSLLADDFTHQNVLYRERVYDEVNPIIFGNTYMLSIFKESYLFKTRRMEKLFPVINENEFKLFDKNILRKEFVIPDTKKFVMFFGAQHINDERKGMKYLFEALQYFADSLSLKEKQEILLLIAGSSGDNIESLYPFDYVEFGFVDFSVLPKLYAVSDVYLSPSVLDAGPMMINQSLSCGVPVVAFETGVATDVLKGTKTGYCAKLRNTHDFAKGIGMIYNLDEKDRSNMSLECRQIALETTSYEVSVENLIRVYNSCK